MYINASSCPERYCMQLLYAMIKPNLSKDGDGKPRVLAPFEKSRKTP